MSNIQLFDTFLLMAGLFAFFAIIVIGIMKPRGIQGRDSKGRFLKAER